MTPDSRVAVLHPRRLLSVLLALLCALALAVAAGPRPTALEEGGARGPVEVIIQAAHASLAAAEQAVQRLGGQVGVPLPIINGFTARVPAAALPALQADTSIVAVTPDGQVTLESGTFDPATDPTSMPSISHIIEADYLWDRGFTGQGIGIAMIDSGVVPIQGLTDNVFHGPDLSFEGGNADLRYLDTYGHGTHMAGIIAGRDPGWTPGSTAEFGGIAPDATLVSVKVAVANGMADVSQVIAAIDWVVQHRADHNVRVLNLAFGTNGTQDYTLDPLIHAVENAWHKGIVVVAAAGNSGFTGGRLKNPAYDPYVIAVGATDSNGTKPVHDDTVPSWSNWGDGIRNPDVVAPGVSVVSLRNPGSYVDITYPAGRVEERYFRGTGTSQATAIVSGAAALLIQQRPNLTPDQVKALLRNTAVSLPAADPVAQGQGLVNVKAAARALTPIAKQLWPQATGLGLIELARGTAHVTDGLDLLLGEVDAGGNLWNALQWSLDSAAGVTWAGGEWIEWEGNSWHGNSWHNGSWNGNSWHGNSWHGNSWHGNSWHGEWTGNSWHGGSWSGNSWHADVWSTGTWE